VNRDGKVISAEPGVRGTNILDENLLEAARKAALKASFNAKVDAAYTQQGTITYHFVLE
jgi:TonB family protein